jgi:hypothetical protein
MGVGMSRSAVALCAWGRFILEINYYLGEKKPQLNQGLLSVARK